MEGEINKTILCLLCYNKKTNRLVLDVFPYKQYFLDEISELEYLCNQKTTSTKKIVAYINSTTQLKKLEGKHDYCVGLNSKYQGFRVNLKERINNLISFEKIIIKRNAEEPLKFPLEERFSTLKSGILKDFKLWVKSYSLAQAYKECKLLSNKKVFVHSHRKIGFSMPEFKLSPNFFVQLKTNFGYGNASYFYLQIRYKKIKIIPLSEWVSYKVSNFSGVIRYSKSFTTRIYRTSREGEAYYESIIQEKNWQRAFEYTIEACNCSLQSEKSFIQKYILDECKTMIQGLNDVYENSHFTFEGETGKYYDIDFEGHQLIEFRGEKISGALDFIDKIIEYKKIIDVNSFLQQIEKLNKQLNPILKKEITELEINLAPLEKRLKKLNKLLSHLRKEKIEYEEKKKQIRKMLIKRIGLKAILDDKEIVQNEFSKQHPDYNDFLEEYNEIKEKRTQLRQKIRHLTSLKIKISRYSNKISAYFK